MKLQAIKILLTILVFWTNTLFGQNDTLQKTTLATHDSLNIQVIRVGKCESHQNYYYVVHNSDSILFKYTDRCITQDPIEYQESADIKFLQLDSVGKPELILEYKYSGDMNYTGYNKSTIIMNLDSMEIIFRARLVARGRHIYGEEWGDLFNYKYDLSFTDSGNITILKKSKDSSDLREGIYTIVDGKYVLQKEK